LRKLLGELASDMRDAVRELDWVRSVSVKLLDHFSADLINRGLRLAKATGSSCPAMVQRSKC
jgi:hypothetical protein